MSICVCSIDPFSANLATDLPLMPLAGSEVLVLFLLSEWSDRAKGLTPLLQPWTLVCKMTLLQRKQMSLISRGMFYVSAYVSMLHMLHYLRDCDDDRVCILFSSWLWKQGSVLVKQIGKFATLRDTTEWRQKRRRSHGDGNFSINGIALDSCRS